MTHQTYEVTLTDWQWTLVKIALINQQAEWERQPSQANPVVGHSADTLTYILSRIDAASKEDSTVEKEFPDGP